jgi:NADPH:quinone reductase-like Zn-dependent oxidoreductase
MRAAVAVAQSATDPIPCLVVRDEPLPEVPAGWHLVRVRAAALTPHDLWTLRGVGHPADRLPMILGCEGVGETEDGRRVLLHGVIADPDAGGDETLDPRRAILSERHPGTFAEYIALPERNLVPLPDALADEVAACLPITWGTAFRMLFTRAGIRPGDRVLVQGGSGGVSAAAIWLAARAGATVYATARTPQKRAYAESFGARAVEPGARLPERVDVVVDTVGEATWAHSLRCLRPGGTVVTCGATTGGAPDPELHRVFFQQLRVVGSTACTVGELAALVRFVEHAGPLPATIVDRVLPLADIRAGFEALAAGQQLGKIVVTP